MSFPEIGPVMTQNYKIDCWMSYPEIGARAGPISGKLVHICNRSLSRLGYLRISFFDKMILDEFSRNGPVSCPKILKLTIG